MAVDACGVQTASALVRQADGLLSAFGADAGGDAGDSAHLNPAGSASFQASVGRWKEFGVEVELCGAGQARGVGAGLSDRSQVCRNRSIVSDIGG